MLNVLKIKIDQKYPDAFSE